MANTVFCCSYTKFWRLWSIEHTFACDEIHDARLIDPPSRCARSGQRPCWAAKLQLLTSLLAPIQGSWYRVGVAWAELITSKHQSTGVSPRLNNGSNPGLVPRWGSVGGAYHIKTSIYGGVATPKQRGASHERLTESYRISHYGGILG